ncbi:MAG: rRNA maturation RNase YbeY [Cyanobacteria bacterium P01_E01_bin.34]
MTSQQSASSQLDLYVNAEVAAPVSLAEWQQWFEDWLEAMQVLGSSELSVILTNDERMQTLNHRYRDRNTPTDVLAFAAQEASIPGHSEETPLVLGDIVISVPTAQRQAEEQQHSLSEELAWLASHGLLHLLGWDHPNEDSLQLMLQKQRDLLKYTRE